MFVVFLLVSVRMSSGRFEEYRNHEWFSIGVDWARIETETFLDDVLTVNDMMDFRDGQFTPKEDCATVADEKQQEALSFADLDDIDTQDQEPLFTLTSYGFRAAIAKIDAGHLISEADMFEEPELVRDNFKFCKYKFQSERTDHT